MAITYVPVLPTVLIDANMLPQPALQGAGLSPARVPPAIHWSEDAPTRIYTPLPPPPPEEDRPIPSRVGEELIARAGITPQTLLSLERWMESRGLRAGFYTSAMDYLARMHREGTTPAEPANYYIGCGLKDDLRIEDPYVRPSHLSVLPDAKGRYWIRNRFAHTVAYLTRSGNDPMPLPSDSRLRLMPGDIISLGNTHLEFRLVGRKASFVRTRPPVVFDPDEITQVDFRWNAG